MAHRHARGIVAAATAIATASAVVASMAGPAQAKAKAAPVWTKLSAGAGINSSNQPSVARWGTKLLVAWTQDNASIHSRLLGSGSKTIGPIGIVVSGWASIDPNPRAVVLGGVPSVAFAGSRGPTGDPYNGPVLLAQSANAATWAISTSALTHSVSAGDDAGIGVVDEAGAPLTALAGANSSSITIHHGTDGAIPATTPDTAATGLGEVQDLSLARDLKSDISYAAWYSGLSDASQGIHAAEVSPAVGAASGAAPFSLVTYAGQPTSTSPGQNIALAARIGGGVWAAYGSGYPGAHKLVLWNLQTGRTLTLSRTSGEIQYVSLSAAPGGRLWVSWTEGGTVYATRTSPSVTKFGVLRSVVAPGGYSPSRTAGDGALGPLDAIINVTNGNAPPAIYSARILEGVRVSVSPAKVSFSRGGTVVVSVTDAGVPVPGISVKVGSVVKVSNAKGLVSFAVPAHAAKGARPVSASGTGWWPGASSFTVG